MMNTTTELEVGDKILLKRANETEINYDIGLVYSISKKRRFVTYVTEKAVIKECKIVEIIYVEGVKCTAI